MELKKVSLAAAAVLIGAGALAFGFKASQADNHEAAAAAEAANEAPAAAEAANEAPAVAEAANEAPAVAEAEAEAEAPAAVEIAEPAGPGTPYFLGETVYGDPDAPVTITEYASLACGHCSAFHTETLPLLKERYIDTGKVRLVYRDFPTNDAAMVAAMVARCGGQDTFFPFIDKFMSQQDAWLRADNPFLALQAMAEEGGVNQVDFMACVSSQDLAEDIVSRAMIGQSEQGVTSTPSFVINGQTYAGNRGIAFFDEMLAPLLQ